jgi:predicted alpha/beta-hydrolase family hydrolase
LVLVIEAEAAPDLLIEGPDDAPVTLVLAHGAGGPMDSPFMTTVATGIARAGARVVRFEFPYMRARREGGRRAAPDPEPALRQSWHDVLARLGGGARLVIGGKSLGGRIASLVADVVGVRGLVCLGYPFHPPGQPARLRTAHLEGLSTPTLIVQGTRDAFGSREEVLGYRLSSRIRLAWIGGGDHSFKPPARSGRTEAENLAEAVTRVTEFLAALGPAAR